MNSKLQSTNVGDAGTSEIAVNLKSGVEQATKLSTALKKAQTESGTSFASLNANLKAAGTSAEQMAYSLQQAGATGSLNTLITQLSTADRGLISATAKIKEMQRVMTQSIKFNAAMAIQNFTVENIQSAVSWVQELDSALNEIAIVAPSVGADMEALGKSVLQGASDLRVAASEYAEAALIFYQQGLDSSEVSQRTEYTIMAAKASGTAVEEMSSQLTAIWNTYQMTGDEMGRAASVAAELGAKTAASFADIAQGMQTAASGASMLGVEYDSLAAIISTVVDKTQQSSATVSTAYKTIFARFTNLATSGEDAGESLGSITQSLYDMGINVLDAEGSLKDLDVVIQDCGQSWDNYSRNQQIAIAQTVGGTRQYQQFLSLMENFDAYQLNLATANAVTDTTVLETQYLTAIETIDTAITNSEEAWSEAFSQIFTSDAQIGVYNQLEEIGDGAANFIEILGGLEGILTIVGVMLISKIVPALSTGAAYLKEWATTLTPQGQMAALQKQFESIQNIATAGISSATQKYAAATAEVNRLKSALDEATVNAQTTAAAAKSIQVDPNASETMKSMATASAIMAAKAAENADLALGTAINNELAAKAQLQSLNIYTQKVSLAEQFAVQQTIINNALKTANVADQAALTALQNRLSVAQEMVNNSYDQLAATDKERASLDAVYRSLIKNAQAEAEQTAQQEKTNAAIQEGTDLTAKAEATVAEKAAAQMTQVTQAAQTEANKIIGIATEAAAQIKSAMSLELQMQVLGKEDFVQTMGVSFSDPIQAIQAQVVKLEEGITSCSNKITDAQAKIAAATTTWDEKRYNLSIKNVTAVQSVFESVLAAKKQELAAAQQIQQTDSETYQALTNVLTQTPYQMPKYATGVVKESNIYDSPEARLTRSQVGDVEQIITQKTVQEGDILDTADKRQNVYVDKREGVDTTIPIEPIAEQYKNILEGVNTSIEIMPEFDQIKNTLEGVDSSKLIQSEIDQIKHIIQGIDSSEQIPEAVDLIKNIIKGTNTAEVIPTEIDQELNTKPGENTTEPIDTEIDREVNTTPGEDTLEPVDTEIKREVDTTPGEDTLKPVDLKLKREVDTVDGENSLDPVDLDLKREVDTADGENTLKPIDTELKREVDTVDGENTLKPVDLDLKREVDTADGEDTLDPVDLKLKREVDTADGEDTLDPIDTKVKREVDTIDGENTLKPVDTKVKREVDTIDGENTLKPVDTEVKRKVDTIDGEDTLKPIDTELKREVDTADGEDTLKPVDLDLKREVDTTDGKDTLKPVDTKVKREVDTIDGEDTLKPVNTEIKREVDTVDGEDTLKPVDAKIKREVDTIDGENTLKPIDTELKREVDTIDGEDTLKPVDTKIKREVDTVDGENTLKPINTELKREVDTVDGEDTTKPVELEIDRRVNTLPGVDTSKEIPEAVDQLKNIIEGKDSSKITPTEVNQMKNIVKGVDTSKYVSPYIEQIKNILAGIDSSQQIPTAIDQVKNIIQGTDTSKVIETTVFQEVKMYANTEGLEGLESELQAVRGVTQGLAQDQELVEQKVKEIKAAFTDAGIEFTPEASSSLNNLIDLFNRLSQQISVTTARQEALEGMILRTKDLMGTGYTSSTELVVNQVAGQKVDTPTTTSMDVVVNKIEGTNTVCLPPSSYDVLINLQGGNQDLNIDEQLQLSQAAAIELAAEFDILNARKNELQAKSQIDVLSPEEAAEVKDLSVALETLEGKIEAVIAKSKELAATKSGGTTTQTVDQVQGSKVAATDTSVSQVIDQIQGSTVAPVATEATRVVTDVPGVSQLTTPEDASRKVNEVNGTQLPDIPDEEVIINYTSTGDVDGPDLKAQVEAAEAELLEYEATITRIQKALSQTKATPKAQGTEKQQAAYALTKELAAAQEGYAATTVKIQEFTAAYEASLAPAPDYADELALAEQELTESLARVEQAKAAASKVKAKPNQTGTANQQNSFKLQEEVKAAEAAYDAASVKVQNFKALHEQAMQQASQSTTGTSTIQVGVTGTEESKAKVQDVISTADSAAPTIEVAADTSGMTKVEGVMSDLKSKVTEARTEVTSFQQAQTATAESGAVDTLIADYKILGGEVSTVKELINETRIAQGLDPIDFTLPEQTQKIKYQAEDVPQVPTSTTMNVDLNATGDLAAINAQLETAQAEATELKTNFNEVKVAYQEAMTKATSGPVTQDDITRITELARQYGNLAGQVSTADKKVEQLKLSQSQLAANLTQTITTNIKQGTSEKINTPTDQSMDLSVNVSADSLKTLEAQLEGTKTEITTLQSVIEKTSAEIAETGGDTSGLEILEAALLDLKEKAAETEAQILKIKTATSTSGTTTTKTQGTTEVVSDADIAKITAAEQKVTSLVQEIAILKQSVSAIPPVDVNASGAGAEATKALIDALNSKIATLNTELKAASLELASMKGDPLSQALQDGVNQTQQMATNAEATRNALNNIKVPEVPATAISTTAAASAVPDNESEIVDATGMADYEAAAKAQQAMYKYADAVRTANGDIKALDAALDALKTDFTEIGSAAEQAGGKQSIMAEAMQKAVGQLQGGEVYGVFGEATANNTDLANALSASMRGTAAESEKLEDGYRSLAFGANQNAEGQRNLASASADVKNTVKAQVMSLKDFSTQATQLASGAYMLSNGITNLSTALIDGEMSASTFLASISQLVPGLVMTIGPMTKIISSLGALGSKWQTEGAKIVAAKNADTAATARNAATDAIETVTEGASATADLAGAKAKENDRLQTELNTKAGLANAGADVTETITEGASGVADSSSIITKASNTITGALAAAKTAFTGFAAAVGATTAVVIAAFAAVAVAAVAFVAISYVNTKKELTELAETTRTAADSAHETLDEIQELSEVITTNTETLRDNIDAWKSAVNSGESATEEYGTLRDQILELNAALEETGAITENIDLGQLATQAFATGDFDTYLNAVETAANEIDRIEAEAMANSNIQELQALQYQITLDNLDLSTMWDPSATYQLDGAQFEYTNSYTDMTTGITYDDYEQYCQGVADRLTEDSAKYEYYLSIGYQPNQIESMISTEIVDNMQMGSYDKFVGFGEDIDELMSQYDTFKNISSDGFSLSFDDAGEFRQEIQDTMSLMNDMEATMTSDELADSELYTNLCEIIEATSDSYTILNENISEAKDTILAYGQALVETVELTDGLDFAADLAQLQSVTSQITTWGAQLGMTTTEIDALVRSIVSMNSELNRTMALSDLATSMTSKFNAEEIVSYPTNEGTGDINTRSMDIDTSGLTESAKEALDGADTMAEALERINEARDELTSVKKSGIGTWNNGLSAQEEYDESIADDLEALDKAETQLLENMEQNYVDVRQQMVDAIDNMSVADQDILIELGIENAEDLDEVLAKIEAYKDVELRIDITTTGDILTQIADLNEYQDILQDAIDEYQENGELGNDTVLALIESGYKEYIVATADGYKLNTTAAEEYNASIDEENALIETLMGSIHDTTAEFESLAYAAADFSATVDSSRLGDFGEDLTDICIDLVNTGDGLDDLITKLGQLDGIIATLNLSDSDIANIGELIISASEALADFSSTAKDAYLDEEMTSGEYIRAQQSVIEGVIAAAEASVKVAEDEMESLQKQMEELDESEIDFQPPLVDWEIDFPFASNDDEIAELQKEYDDLQETIDAVNEEIKGTGEESGLEELLKDMSDFATFADAMESEYDVLSKFMNEDFTLKVGVEGEEALIDSVQNIINSVDTVNGENMFTRMADDFNSFVTVTQSGITGIEEYFWNLGQSTMYTSDGVIQGATGMYEVFNGVSTATFASVMDYLADGTIDTNEAMSMSTEEAALAVQITAINGAETMGSIGENVGDLFDAMGDLITTFDYSITVIPDCTLEIQLGTGGNIVDNIGYLIENGHLPLSIGGSMNFDVSGTAGDATTTAINNFKAAAAGIASNLEVLLPGDVSGGSGSSWSGMDAYKPQSLTEVDPYEFKDPDGNLGGGGGDDDGDDEEEEDIFFSQSEYSQFTDRYADTQTALDSIENSIDTISTLSDNSVGAARIAAMEQLNTAIQDQAEAYSKLVAEAKQYYYLDDNGEGIVFGIDATGAQEILEGVMGDADRLQQKMDILNDGLFDDWANYVKAAQGELENLDEAIEGYGDWGLTVGLQAEFDEYGFVTNSEEILARYSSDLVDLYYSLTDIMPDEDGVMSRSFVSEEAEAFYNAAYSKIESIGESIDLTNESAQQMLDGIMANYESIFTWLENKVAMAQYKTELRIEVNEQDLKEIEKILSRLSDEEHVVKIQLAVESFDNYESEVAAYIDEYTRYQEIVDNLSATTNQEFFISKFGQEAWELFLDSNVVPEELWEAMGDVVDELDDLDDEMYDQISTIYGIWMDVIDYIEEQYDTVFDKLDSFADMLSSYESIWESVGNIWGETDTTEMITELSLDNQLDSIDTLNSEYSNLMETYGLTQSLYAEIVDSLGADSDLAETYAAEIEDLEQAIIDNRADALSSVADYLVDLESAAEQSAEIIFNSFVDGLEGLFADLDSFLEMFDQYTDMTTFYVNDIEGGAAIFEMLDEVQTAMESTTDASELAMYQQLEDYYSSLIEERTELMMINGELEEVTVWALKDSVDLTQDQLDIMEQEFELAKAQAAWEEAQNNKDTMVLARDASGNYSYVYSSDTSDDSDEYSASDINSMYADIYTANIEASASVQELWAQCYDEYVNYMNDVDWTRMEYDTEYAAEVEKRKEWYLTQLGQYEETIEYHNNAVNASYEETALGVITQTGSMSETNEKYVEAVDEMVLDLKENYEYYEEKASEALSKVGISHDNLTGSVWENTTLIMGYNDAVANSVGTMQSEASSYLVTSANEVSAWGTKCIGVYEAVALAIDGVTESYKNMTEVMTDDLTYSDDTDYTSINFQMLADMADGEAVSAATASLNASSLAAKVADAYEDGTFEDLNFSGLSDENMSESQIKYANTITTSYSDSELAQITDLITAKGDDYDYEYYQLLYARWAKIRAVLAGLTDDVESGWISQTYAKDITFAEFLKKDYDWINDAILSEMLGFTTTYLGYQTGGLATGPQIATLAEDGKKELVLNSTDTENMLMAIEIMRDSIAQYLNNLGKTQSSTIAGQEPSVITTDNSQSIVINADFPSVSAREEIEAAFANIVNQAAQYQIK